MVTPSPPTINTTQSRARFDLISGGVETYLVLLSFERLILRVLGGDLVGGVVVGVDNVGFGHFGRWKVVVVVVVGMRMKRYELLFASEASGLKFASTKSEDCCCCCCCFLTDWAGWLVALTGWLVTGEETKKRMIGGGRRTR